MSKERLVELHEEAVAAWDTYLNMCEGQDVEPEKTFDEFVADYLLANGVIVPPCKVGSKVYWQNMGGKITEATVIKLLQARVDKGFEYDIPFEEIGKTIFLTREEVEAKLKESSHDKTD